VEPACGHAPAAALLMLGSFVLLAAPMALAHSRPGCTTRWWRAWWWAHWPICRWPTARPPTLLFGSFLLWACWTGAARTGATSCAATAYPPARSGSLMTVLAGLLAWAAFAFWGHRWLIGVALGL
jgi:hypothetical protein